MAISIMIVLTAASISLSVSAPTKREDHSTTAASLDVLKDVSYLAYIVMQEDMLQSINHDDDDVKKVILNVIKDITRLSQKREKIVKLVEKEGENATTKMLAVDVVLAGLLQQSCNSLQTLLDIPSFNCSVEDLDQLRVVLEAQETAKSLYTSLKEIAPGYLNSCKWWMCNVVCPGEVSDEVSIYIAQHSIPQCPINLLENKEPYCTTACLG